MKQNHSVHAKTDRKFCCYCAAKAADMFETTDAVIGHVTPVDNGWEVAFEPDCTTWITVRRDEHDEPKVGDFITVTVPKAVAIHSQPNPGRQGTTHLVRRTCDRIKTIADEAFGPFQNQTTVEAVDAIERGIASEQANRERLMAALEVARDLIIKHHDCSKLVQLGCLCPHCSREDGSSPELDQIWDALRTSNTSHHDGAASAPSVDGVVRQEESK